MNGRIQNSPIRPPKTLQPHHIRHIVSGTLVFLLGIMATETIMYLRRHWPKTVRWSRTEIQSNYTVPNGLPPTNVEVDYGITDDGYIVWRPRK
ncbi:MAG TPA: hypothetical protein VLT36_25685 [Candidatus Dormibacteraeota bacterium]|nr:hypothetical protein [Candidatus Dormibacteraeota bacterium]